MLKKIIYFFAYPILGICYGAAFEVFFGTFLGLGMVGALAGFAYFMITEFLGIKPTLDGKKKVLIPKTSQPSKEE